MLKTRMDSVGFGTWGIHSRDINATLRAAVAAGYRTFDCSPLYKNEKAVGNTLASLMSEGVIKRRDVFLTSKVPPTDACSRNRTFKMLRQTLRDLRTTHIDLYLVHWPFCKIVVEDPPLVNQLGYSAAQLRETWNTMEEIASRRLARSIGLSNVGVNRLKALLAAPDLRVPPAVVQVEHHPFNANRALRRFCASTQPSPIRITAYSSLGSSERPRKYQSGQQPLLEDHTLVSVANALGTTPATVALAWALRSGVAIIPKSTQPERIVANRREVLAISPRLSAQQMEALDSLDRNFHYLSAAWAGYAWRPGMSLQELYDDPDPGSQSSWLATLIQFALVLAVAAACLREHQRRLNTVNKRLSAIQAAERMSIDWHSSRVADIHRHALLSQSGESQPESPTPSQTSSWSHIA